MLHFLRIIRKDLIHVNNVKKYFLYAIGEILLIVLGILIAMQIGNWNQGRLERIEERQIFIRVHQNLEEYEGLTDYLEAMPPITEALEGVAKVFAGEPIEDNESFLKTVIMAGRFRAPPRLDMSVYDTLVNSGKFGLIRNTELAQNIAGYYKKVVWAGARVTDRESQFPDLVDKLVPRIGQGKLKAGLSEEAYASIVQSVLNSDLDEYILQAQNWMEFLESVYRDVIRSATELKAEIETELEGR